MHSARLQHVGVYSCKQSGFFAIGQVESPETPDTKEEAGDGEEIRVGNDGNQKMGEQQNLTICITSMEVIHSLYANYRYTIFITNIQQAIHN